MTPQTFIARCESANILLFRNPDGSIKLRSAIKGAVIPAAVKTNVARYKSDLLPLLSPAPAAEPEIDPALVAEARAAEAAMDAVWADAMRVLFADADAGLLPRQAGYAVAPGSTVDDLNKYVCQALGGLRYLKNLRDQFAAYRPVGLWDTAPTLNTLRLTRAQIEWEQLETLAFWWRAAKPGFDGRKHEKGAYRSCSTI